MQRSAALASSRGVPGQACFPRLSQNSRRSVSPRTAKQRKNVAVRATEKESDAEASSDANTQEIPLFPLGAKAHFKLTLMTSDQSTTHVLSAVEQADRAQNSAANTHTESRGMGLRHLVHKRC